MSIADLYSSEKDKNLVSHFQNLLAIALSDGKVTDSEMALLLKAGKRLGLNQADIEEMAKDDVKLKFAPPVDLDSRNMRFVRLMAMIWADGEISEQELKMARRLAVGLGIPDEKIDGMIDKVGSMLLKGMGVDDVADSL